MAFTSEQISEGITFVVTTRFIKKSMDNRFCYDKAICPELRENNSPYNSDYVKIDDAYARLRSACNGDYELATKVIESIVRGESNAYKRM